MRRRELLTQAASAAGLGLLIPSTTHADETPRPIPGAIPVELGKEFQLNLQSPPVTTRGGAMHLISLGKGILALASDGRLTATIHGGVKQYADTEYWISLAAYDPTGSLLGVATHKEQVRYIRLGSMPTLLRDFEFNFGISRSFSEIAWLTASLSDRDVPPPDGA
jgi:hypothetical protein